MATNLVDNVRNALEGCAMKSVYGWTDSMVPLYWITGKGKYRQFVANRVKQIKAKDYIQWGHVSSGENPADLGSRGNQSKELPALWLKGPDSNQNCGQRQCKLGPAKIQKQKQSW